MKNSSNLIDSVDINSGIIDLKLSQTISSKNMDLVTAIFFKDIEKVRRLLDEGADPNSQFTPRASMTVTEHAVESGSYDIARLLIDAGVKINAKSGINSTLTHLAIKNGEFDFSRFLIESGANVNAINDDHQTPLFLCAENKFKEDTKKISSITEILLGRGAKINAVNNQNFTALIQAAYNGNTTLCQILIRSGASVELKDKTGNTALNWAARRGHGMTCAVLVESGACLDSKNIYGTTPFIAAAQGGHLGIVELLKASGANIFETTDKGESALHWSASFGFKDLSSLLLDMYSSSIPGQFFDCPDGAGKTPLSHAAERGSVAICEMLLDKLANPNSFDQQNETPLHCAARSKGNENHAGVCRLLIERGALTENRNSNGQTPLHVAAITGTEQCVTALILNDADFTAKGGPAGTMSAAGFAGKHKRKGMVQHIKAMVQCRQAERAIEEIMSLGKNNEISKNNRVGKSSIF